MKKQLVFGLLGAAFFACGESPAEPACGDGVIDAGEQCEPPNSASCDAACLIVNLNCGDGLVDGAEQCDDSNVVSGDGCRANCTNEVCGDGLQDPQEQCDDGNTNSGDGCASACTVEGGGVCGNNQAEAGEACDDGNTNNGDGCNAQCQIEAGGNCGNGDRELGEECDDGNTSGNDGCDGQCRVEPPAGQSAAQVEAFHLVNQLRASVGLPGQRLSAQLDQAAQGHADYFALNGNAGAANGNPHVQIQGLPGFTGVQFFDRTNAAGFSGQAFFEVMAFFDSPQPAVDIWLNSVFHRVPLIHPNATQMGYGGASGNGGSADVIDFGAGASEDATQIVLFPPPNATNVVGSFDTRFEGPNPPNPPGGGTVTGPIVSVLSDADLSVTVAQLFDGNTSLPVTIINGGTPGVGAFMSGTVAFYAAGPAPAGKTFRAHIEGTIGGQAFTRDWTFTTQ